MTPVTDSSLTPGAVLAGKYRVERVLGQGGMGVVVAAQHVHLEERVAIKLMLADAAFSSEAVARFVREARAAAQLESAHVAKVSDVGTLEDGRPYMVMEYLDGQDLANLLATSGPLPIQDAVDYLLQAGEAIAEAHCIGIVHRDLKPANLFLTRRRDRTPHVKVLDFGISKVSGSARSSSDNAMTKTSTLMGSPLYMSPEQMTSVKDVDARSDIWALGIILFELLTGGPPFVGETLPQVCGLVIQSPAPSASSRRPDLPSAIDTIIHRCLAKAPSERFQSVADLAAALQPFAGRHGRASAERISLLAGGAEPPSMRPPLPTPVLTPVAAAHSFPGTHASWGETKPPILARRSGAWLALAVLGAPALAAALWWLTGVKPTAVAARQPAAGVTQTSLPAPSSVVPAPSSWTTTFPPAQPAAVVQAAETTPLPSVPPPRPPVAKAKPQAGPAGSAAPLAKTVQVADAAPALPAPAPQQSSKPPPPPPKQPAGMGGRL